MKVGMSIFMQNTNNKWSDYEVYRNDLKLASLRRDREWVGKARDVAFELVDADPTLAGHPNLLAEIEASLDEEEREFLFKG